VQKVDTFHISSTESVNEWEHILGIMQFPVGEHFDSPAHFIPPCSQIIEVAEWSYRGRTGAQAGPLSGYQKLRYSNAPETRLELYG